MVLNVPGLVAIAVLYLCLLGVGIYAAYKKKEKKHEKRSEIMIVARRDTGYLLGVLTMTATFVGGGVINGTSEGIYSPDYGLVWTFTPFIMGPTIILNAFLMAKKFRSAEYLTMLDPFQNKYGKYMGSLFYIPACLGELFYAASILSALGSTIAFIIEVDIKAAIIVSSSIAVFYTLIGGFYSVAYTDAVQLICMFVGLYLALPFAMTHPAVSSISDTAHFIASTNSTGWLGKWEASKTVVWLDQICIWTLGAIPWQGYYQRILSTTTPETGFRLSIVAGICFTFFVIPPVLYGATAVSTDWNQTAYGLPTPLERGHSAFILPIVFQYLTPTPIAIVGLAAICTAVMSSMDSTLLSASSMFGANVYKKIIRKNASDIELMWCLRVSILIFGAGACACAIFATSIYGLLVLCVDLVYVVIFPQFVSVMYLDVNTYGALPAFAIAFILRLGAGEPTFNMAPYIYYPEWFPYRTFSMCMSELVLVVVSFTVRYLFTNGYLKPHHDILKCNLSSGGRSRLRKIMKMDDKFEKDTDLK